MKEAINTLKGWIDTFNELLKALIVLGVVVGIVYGDIFGVIGGIGILMSQVGHAGLSGLIAIIIVATWNKNGEK